jgi:glucose-6-phosphate 1-epimerase
MDAASLQKRFGMPDVLTFDEQSGLTRVHVHTPEAKATIYLQGAHLTAWEPAGLGPAIFLSSKSEFAPGKPIRGGVPVIFPWFANDSKKDRVNGHPGPSHGFARIQDWSLDSVHRNHGETTLVFTLGPTSMSRSMGFDAFLLTLKFVVGRELRMAMTVDNKSSQPLVFEDGFHTYYKIDDVQEVSVSGLENVPYIDKVDGFKVKPAAGVPIVFTQRTDRIYNNTSTPLTIDDKAGRRKITVEKSGSNSTVVWNQFGEMPDLGPWEWHGYVAVETTNVGVNAVTLAAGASTTIEAHAVMEKLSS